MPTINLTNNTGVTLTASSADNGATLNRYLTSTLSFRTPPHFDATSQLLVRDQRELDFPLLLSATGAGEFALEKTSFNVQLGASASIGLLQGSDEAGFFAALGFIADPASSGLVSFSVGGTLSVEDDAAQGDLTFGIKHGETFALTSYQAAAANDTLVGAVGTAIETLTIPHDLADLESLPTQAICRVEAAGSLKFSASFTYSFLNDPLASVPLGSLPSFNIGASASATLEGQVTHSSKHTVTIAKLSRQLIHLSVGLTRTDDFETSLKVSAGVTAKIGSQDALAFLLDKIEPNSAAEAEAIAADLPNAAAYKADIKAAIDLSLSAALAASLKVAMEQSTAKSRVFVYEVTIDQLDAPSTVALQAALTGDFTALTKAGAQWNGIRLLDSALTVTATHTHTMALHFFGIFNAASVHKFVAKSKFDFTADTHEIVLCDETIEDFNNNLDAGKLRKLVLKSITLTLPASANTREAKTPVTLAYLDRDASTSTYKMRQIVNVLNYLAAPEAAAAQSLLNRRLGHYGVCSISLALSLAPAQCRQLFQGPNGWYLWPDYVAAFCTAQKIITAGDDNFAYRSILFDANRQSWQDLHDASAGAAIASILKQLGMSDGQAQLETTDVLTAVWWADAMASFATALKDGQSLVAAGKNAVKKANGGYNEPWMVLSAWALSGKPQISVEFATSFPQPALGAAANL